MAPRNTNRNRDADIELPPAESEPEADPAMPTDGEAENPEPEPAATEETGRDDGGAAEAERIVTDAQRMQEEIDAQTKAEHERQLEQARDRQTREADELAEISGTDPDLVSQDEILTHTTRFTQQPSPVAQSQIVNERLHRTEGLEVAAHRDRTVPTRTERSAAGTVTRQIG